MRGIFFPMVLFVAVLGALTTLMILQPDPWWSRVAATVSGIVGSSQQTSGWQPNPPVETARPENKHRTARRGLRAGGEGSVTVVAVPMPERTETPHAFPLAPEVMRDLKGSEKSDVLARFGVPDATVTGADLGQLRERLIYVDPTTRRKTMIVLVNGSVVGAETYTT